MLQIVFWIGGAAAAVVGWALVRRHGTETVTAKFRAATSRMGRAEAPRMSAFRPQADLLQEQPPAPRAAAARETWLRREIQHIGAEWFPDDRQCDWLVHGFEHRGHLTLVEVEPRPQTVGYPRFKFVASFAPAERAPDQQTPARAESVSDPEIIAVYCLQEGQYSLLATAPGKEARLPAVLAPIP